MIDSSIVNYYTLWQAINEKFSQAIIAEVLRLRQEIHQFLQGAGRAADILKLEGANQLTFLKLSLDPVFSDIFIPLKFEIAAKKTDFIEQDFTLKCF